MSFTSIWRLLNVSNVAILKWVRELIPKICKKPEIDKRFRAKKVELDEMWHYLRSKKANLDLESLSL
jgi:hypothetical protein